MTTSFNMVESIMVSYGVNIIIKLLFSLIRLISWEKLLSKTSIK